VAGTVLSLFLLVFLGDEAISTRLSRTLILFQFTPSLLKLIHRTDHMAGTCFILLVSASFLFGRFYCSFLCPVGILQDGMIRLRRRFYGRHRYRYLKAYPVIRYAILLATVVTLAFGSLTLLNLLDPYSLFGRMAAHPFKSLIIWLNNLAAGGLESFDIYALRVRRMHHFPLSILLLSLGSLGLLLAFSVTSGRAWCNTICPVGAILGLVSRFSLFRFIINRERCRSCRSCIDVCKAGCIDGKRFEIDPARCVVCFNCLDSCAKSAVTYRAGIQAAVPVRWAPSKRGFLLTAAVAGGTLLSAVSLFRPAALAAVKTLPAPVIPPGAGSIAQFTKSCSACHLCVSVCPTNVLTPAYWEYGVAGIMQPKMDYWQGHCDFDCCACSQVCPTCALRPFSLSQKRQTRIGSVILDRRICIVHVRKKHCGACGEACPTHAIFPVEKGLVLFPEIANDYCIGCGACEHACPTAPKAIRVVPEPVHSTALKYELSAPAEMPTDDTESGFPF